MSKYIVVQSSSQFLFEEEVNEKLRKGYKIVPSSFHYTASILGENWAQAMIKEEK